jgi:hypothetical protein
VERVATPEAVGTILAEEVRGEAAELEQAEHPACRLVGQSPLALDHVSLCRTTPTPHQTIHKYKFMCKNHLKSRKQHALHIARMEI